MASLFKSRKPKAERARVNPRPMEYSARIAARLWITFPPIAQDEKGRLSPNGIGFVARTPKVSFLKGAQRVKDKLQRLVRRSVCKNCGEPIRVGNDGCWVHDDPDEDPAAFDYGWARCLPKSEDDFENYAEPQAVASRAPCSCSPCPVPTDPEQRLDITCAHCGVAIDFATAKVYVNGPSYVCRLHAANAEVRHDANQPTNQP